jgi:hypothetical protein
MRDHLSEEQLNNWLLGNAERTASQHLEACTVCRREADELRQALDQFRDSIHTTARAYKLPWRAPAQPARQASARFTRRWAYAAVLAAILAASAVLLRTNYPRPSHPGANAAGEDEILMQIQADVGQSIPDALAPGELLLAGAEEPPPTRLEDATKTKSGNRR